MNQVQPDQNTNRGLQTPTRLEVVKPSNKPKGRQMLVWWVVLLVLVSAVFLIVRNGLGQPISVDYAVAKTTEITGSFSAEAYVRGKVYDVASEASGKVVRIVASEGQTISKGSVLAEIEDTDAVQSLARAEAARRVALDVVNQAKAELKLSQRTSDAAIESARMRVRQAEKALQRARLGPQPEEVSQAENRVAIAQASLDDAENAFRRATTLYEQGALSRAALEASETRQKTALAELDSAKAVVKLLTRGPRPEDIAIAQANLDSMQADMKASVESSGQVAIRREALNATENALAQAVAEVNRCRLALSKHKVLAPSSGTISRRLVEVGAIVVAGQAIAQISTREDLRIEAEIDTEDISKVSVGMPVSLTSAAYPSRQFYGKVDSIMPTGELKPGSAIRTRIVRIRIRLDGDWKHFRPEMELDVEGKAAFMKTLVVPSDAVVYVGDAASVWVVKEGVVRRIPVKIGYTNSFVSEILSGVSEGERVVVSKKDRLADGMSIQAKQTNGL